MRYNQTFFPNIQNQYKKITTNYKNHHDQYLKGATSILGLLYVTDQSAYTIKRY